MRPIHVLRLSASCSSTQELGVILSRLEAEGGTVVSCFSDEGYRPNRYIIVYRRRYRWPAGGEYE